ncbi:MAG: flagellar protein FlgN [Candidatus Eisenbacteria bacterium]
MEALLNDLRTLLARQVESLKTLEEVLGEQRDCLVKRDVPGIVRSISTQEEYLKRIQRMEESRLRLVRGLAGHLGIAPADATIRKISDSLDPDVGRELRATAEAARETLEKVGRVNRENRRLIERSLEFVHDMLGALRGRRPSGRTYTPSGDLKPRDQIRTLVDKTT